MRSISLRTKLLSTLLVLLAMTIIISDGATYFKLRIYLYQKLDQQATQTINYVAPAFGIFDRGGSGGTTDSPDAPPPSSGNIISAGQRLSGQLPTGTWLYALSPTGRYFHDPVGGTSKQYPSPLSLMSMSSMDPGTTLSIATVTTTGDNSQIYRVFIQRFSGDGIEAVAVPLSGIVDTLHNLLIGEFIISIGVLILLSVISGAALRVGLAPLQDMTDTAIAIANGDIKRRVRARGSGTEVRRLAAALNTMITRIQGALLKSRASEERLRVFIADVSHELRTPLTSIQGYAELYKTGALLEEQDLRTAIERIYSESKRMGSLVEDLLLLARMDQNRPLDLEEVNMTALVDSAVNDARAVEPGRSISVTHAEEYWVLGDRNKLSQVIANLLSNVRAHTPPGAEVGIRLGASPRTGPLPKGARGTEDLSDLFGGIDPTVSELIWENYVRIEVKDTGPGIEEDQLSKVFERFYRSDASRSRAAGGAGLGLSLVAAIAHAHGGRAWVNSAGAGSGSTFGVDIPLLELGDT